MLEVVELPMSSRVSDYRFLVVLAGLVVALLVACSGDSTPTPSGNGSSGGGTSSGASDAMTHA